MKDDDERANAITELLLTIKSDKIYLIAVDLDGHVNIVYMDTYKNKKHPGKGIVYIYFFE